METLVDDAAPATYFAQHKDRLKNQPLHRTRRGRPNRIGANIRQAIEKVFGELGSWEGMMAWAKDNPDLFYASVVPKLLPHELAESGAGKSIRVIVYGKDSIPNQLDLTPQPVVIEPADSEDASSDASNINTLDASSRTS